MSSFGMLLSDLLGVLFGAEPGETLTLAGGGTPAGRRQTDRQTDSKQASKPIAPSSLMSICRSDKQTHTPARTAADEPANKGPGASTSPTHRLRSQARTQEGGGLPPLNMQWPSPLRTGGRPRPGRGDKRSVSLTVHRSRNGHVRYSPCSQPPQASDHADGGDSPDQTVNRSPKAKQSRHTLSHLCVHFIMSLNPTFKGSHRASSFTMQYA